MRSTRDAHLKADFILILTPIITFLNLAQQVILICCFMAILSRRKPPGPRIMRKFWSNSRVRIQGNGKRRCEDSSHPKGIEVFVRETAKNGCPDPEKFDNPWSHLKIMMFVNLDESWSSKTEILGYDQQSCPGIFLFL